MVKLRLKRMGSKFNAFYRIVAADARAPRDGKFIEEIGTYNPHTKEVRLNEELKTKWLEDGAVPSDTVKNLFTKVEAAKKAGNVNGDIITLIKKAKKAKVATVEVKEETPAEEVKVEEAPAEETKTEEAPAEETKTEEA